MTEQGQAKESPEPDRAAATPCHECPWRVSNQGRPVPAGSVGSFDRRGRIVRWRDLRTGTTFVCHLSVGDRKEFPNGADPEWVAMGFEAIPEHARRRECAGSVAAGLREKRLLDDAGSWEEYLERRPHGFTREAVALWGRRIEGQEVAGKAPLRQVEIADVEIVDPASDDNLSAEDLLTSKEALPIIGKALVEGVRAALACDCPVCTRHGEVHAQVPLSRPVFGETAHVDREMAPLLEALATVGVTSVASCVDVVEATERLWPEKLPDLLGQQGAPGVNYGRVAAEQLAFVRVIDGLRARPVLEALEECGVIVTRERPLAQVAFPRAALPGLIAVIAMVAP